MTSTDRTNATHTGEQAGGRFSTRTWLLVVAVAVPTALLQLPYARSLLEQGTAPVPPTAAVVVGALIQAAVVAGLAASLGLWLGPRIGLGAPDLRDLLHGRPGAGRRTVSALPSAAMLGAGGAGVLLAVQAGIGGLLPERVQQAMTDVVAPPPWQGFLVAISAGVNEEVVFRLGLVTLFAYLGAWLSRRSGPPPAAVVWTAIALAALLFGMVHLPLAAALAGSLPAALIVAVVVGNGVFGTVFGWLYWRRGLVAAVVAHFSANVVLKVIVPAVAPVLA